MSVAPGRGVMLRRHDFRVIKYAEHVALKIRHDPSTGSAS